LTVGTFPPMAP